MFNINSIKNKPLPVLQFLQRLASCIQTPASIVCRDLVPVARVQCVVLSAEVYCLRMCFVQCTSWLM